MALGVALFVGFWAFAYQGYVEDAGIKPLQSWPLGAAAFAFAGGVVVVTVNRAMPGLGILRLTLVAVVVVGLLGAAAVGALDAGNP